MKNDGPWRSRLTKYWETNYKAEVHASPDGGKPKVKYRYIGFWYHITLDEKGLRMSRIRMVILQVCVIAFYLIAGLSNSYFNSMIEVMLPGLLAILPMIFEVFGTAQFCLTKPYMDDHDFNDIEQKLTLATLIHFILMAAAAAFSMIDSLLVGVFSWLPLLYLISGGFSLAMRRTFKDVPYRVETNESHKEFD